MRGHLLSRLAGLLSVGHFRSVADRHTCSRGFGPREQVREEVLGQHAHLAVQTVVEQDSRRNGRAVETPSPPPLSRMEGAMLHLHDLHTNKQCFRELYAIDECALSRIEGSLMPRELMDLGKTAVRSGSRCLKRRQLPVGSGRLSCEITSYLLDMLASSLLALSLRITMFRSSRERLRSGSALRWRAASTRASAVMHADYGSMSACPCHHPSEGSVVGRVSV
jgi:hypothetical protein